MAAQPMVQALMQRCRGNGIGPGLQQLPAHGSQPHPFGEPLSIYLAPQNPQLYQPDQGVFRP